MNDIHAILETTANQILALVAPTTARLVHAAVLFDDGDDTAATDGVCIWLPPVFDGVEVAQDATIAVGLLTHELGHFLQPLEEMEQVEQETGAPHWLVNIILDIQCETLMAALFPPLADALVAVRRVVRRAHMAEYEAVIQKGRNLPEIAAALALAGRFDRPEWPFYVDRASTVSTAIFQITDSRLHSRASQFVSWLNSVSTYRAADLPQFVRRLMDCFPELRQAPAPLPVPGGRLDVGKVGRAAQAEALDSVSTCKFDSSDRPVNAVILKTNPPWPEAVRLAIGLRVHFQASSGATEIVAPGRLDRRAAARGEIVPLRMTLPGREQPRLRVVICLDKSSSMTVNVRKNLRKFDLAQIAAQAVALAVQEAGGEVVGILFDGSAQL
ncbi:MAG: hypothetical protein WHX53_15660, partial [Anaerolineae bacterium]